MSAITVTATVRPDGSLVVEKLPFPPGQQVEVVVRAPADDPTEGGKYPLRGTPGYYIDPFEPACDPDDWEANRYMTHDSAGKYASTLVEFEVTLDGEWKPLSPEEARELRRRLPPPWGTKDLPTEPQPPTE